MRDPAHVCRIRAAAAPACSPRKVNGVRPSNEAWERPVAVKPELGSFRANLGLQQNLWVASAPVADSTYRTGRFLSARYYRKPVRFSGSASSHHCCKYSR